MLSQEGYVQALLRAIKNWDKGAWLKNKKGW